MREQLKDILDRRSELERQLAEALEAEKTLKHDMVTTAGKDLFKHIRKFADSFKSGHTRKLFNKIQESLIELESLDSNYLAVLAGSDPYGEVGTEQLKFLVSYLLGGLWRKDSFLWDVLDKVAELRSQPGNLFLNDDERR